MVYICPVCSIDSSSHSFYRIPVPNTHIVHFYANPAKSTKYKDKENIINHVKGMLLDHKNDDWNLIIDCQGLEMKHVLETETAIELTKMINNHFAEKLHKVLIINPSTLIDITLKIVTPFLDKKVREKIIIEKR